MSAQPEVEHRHLIDATWLPPGPFTLAQWDALEFAEGQRFELAEGMLCQAAPSSPVHSNIAARITRLLNAALPQEWVAVRGIALVLQEAPTTVRVPDVVVLPIGLYEQDPAHIAASDALLAVEVVSPGSRKLDLRTKRLEYEEARIPHYWVVDYLAEDPAGRFSVWRLADDSYRLMSALSGGVVELDEPCGLTFQFNDLLSR